MERILSTEQMRVADGYTIDKLGVPEELLIERAGKAVVDEIVKRFRGGRVLICIGKGNNGEDGKIIAKYLSLTHGFSVAVINVYNGIFKLLDKKFDIIVDCIFGTGLNRAVEGKYKTAIEKINQSGAYIISCDIPSGLNGDTGLAMGVAVKANLTVAIQEYKFGHFLNDGIDYCGEVVAKDIGISIWGDGYAKKLNDVDVKELFPKRKRNVHKGNFGKATVLGGSKNFSGSVMLSALALSALKMGIGYSNLAVPDSLYAGYMGLCPECTFTPLSDYAGNIIYDEKSLEPLLKYDCIAMGMGMGVSQDVYKIISYFLRKYKGVLLIDADGLNALSRYGYGILKQKKCKVVLTPHVGEFSRLLQVKSDIIMPDIIESAKSFAKENGIILLLKSAVSVITDGEEVFINVTGSPAMAKGGSGDVLSGITAGLLARCGYSLTTVASGSYIFGRAGEIAVKDENVYTVTATDIIMALPKAINSL